MGRKSKNSFVIQGSILAFAGILVRIIGLIYRIPLTRILGGQHSGRATNTSHACWDARPTDSVRTLDGCR